MRVNQFCDLSDLTPMERMVLFFILVIAVLSMTGCGTTKPVEQVKRQPPAAAMVRLDPLPHQTDPSLGGIYKGYVNAAQRYRGCVDRLTELQEWIWIDYQ